MLSDLRSIIQQVSESADLEVALEVIVSRVKRSMSVSVCSIYLHDEERSRFLLMASKGLSRKAVRKVSLGFDEGLVGLVASREEPINIEVADQHPAFRYIPETGEEKYSSFLGVPIIHHKRVLGVLVVQQRVKRKFDESDEAFLITLSAQLAGEIAHAESVGDLKRLTSGGGADQEIEFHGLPGSPGIALGSVVVISPVADLYATSAVESRGEKTEMEEFNEAVLRARLHIKNLERSLSSHISDQERLLFTAYVQMLDDQNLGREVKQRIKEGASAQSAWSEVILAHCKHFEAMEDPYFRERAVDIRDLGRRVLSYMQEHESDEIEFPDQTILIGEDLSPDVLGIIPTEKLAGMVSAQGSVNSHLSILARAMGIPTVVGVEGLKPGRLRGKEVIVDGHNGYMYANATPEHRSYFEELRREDAELSTELEQLRDLPAITLDDHRIKLLVNTGLMADVRTSIERGAEGVGLFRSEVPFFMRQRFPTEEEQRQYYRELLEAFSPRPVVMRTLDIGGDKALPYFPIKEDNPFLGWRGIRITLDHPELFLGQVRAMMKASYQLDNLSILFPMVSGVPELEMAVDLVKRAHRELTEEDGFDEILMPKLGAMIEVPSAVFLAREFAKRVDYLSVGSNDLTQYILAVDRNNPRVVDLYDAMHPAVIAALHHVARAARAEGISAGVCGEVAGDPLGALLLVAMGYESLSMSASNLLRVKALIRSSNLSDLRMLLKQVLKVANVEEVHQSLADFVQDPELRKLTKLGKKRSH
ncbi:MAG: phosphoenolpyruvate--protein phosphotransferase [Porticoccaceae bacterium]|nr:phosphoenolpyruvate--protein phosphotransferase [Porticoccaceae bacterium]